jgi:hypothetical protein
MTDQAEDDRYLNSNSVRARYDNVSADAIERWLSGAAPGFPPPIRIAGRKFWSLRALQAFERNAASEKSHRAGQWTPGHSSLPPAASKSKARRRAAA